MQFRIIRLLCTIKLGLTQFICLLCNVVFLWRFESRIVCLAGRHIKKINRCIICIICCHYNSAFFFCFFVDGQARTVMPLFCEQFKIKLAVISVCQHDKHGTARFGMVRRSTSVLSCLDVFKNGRATF